MAYAIILYHNMLLHIYEIRIIRPTITSHVLLLLNCKLYSTKKIYHMIQSQLFSVKKSIWEPIDNHNIYICVCVKKYFFSESVIK